MEGGQMGAGPFFCRRERMRGIPYEIRKDYFIIPYTDQKASIAYPQKLEAIDS
jgi:hypothetical protein